MQINRTEFGSFDASGNKEGGVNRHWLSSVVIPPYSSLPPNTQETLPIPERSYDALQKRITDYLAGYFPYNHDLPTPETMQGKALVEKIWSALCGTEKTRTCPAPKEEAARKNSARIQSFVNEEKPISLVSVIGTAKWPDGPTSANTADLADLASIEMIRMLQERVQSVYKPGIQVRLFYEDVVGEWLFGRSALPNQENYYQSLTHMYAAIQKSGGPLPVTLNRERDMLNLTNCKTPDEFINRSEQVQPLFSAYIQESQQLIDNFLKTLGYADWKEARKALGDQYPLVWQKFAEEHIEPLNSMKLLKQTGWNGLIPPEMRAFYIDRFQTNATGVGTSRQELLDYMAKYYSSTLIKAQLKTPYLQIPGEDRFDPNNALKLAFIGLAPGIPAAFQDAIQMRAFPKTSNGIDNSTAPWRGKGGMLIIPEASGADPRIRVNVCTPNRPPAGPEINGLIHLQNTVDTLPLSIHFRMPETPTK